MTAKATIRPAPPPAPRPPASPGASGDDADVTVDLAVYERVTRGVS